MSSQVKLLPEVEWRSLCSVSDVHQLLTLPSPSVAGDSRSMLGNNAGTHEPPTGLQQSHNGAPVRKMQTHPGSLGIGSIEGACQWALLLLGTTQSAPCIRTVCVYINFCHVGRLFCCGPLPVFINTGLVGCGEPHWYAILLAGLGAPTLDRGLLCGCYRWPIVCICWLN